MASRSDQRRKLVYGKKKAGNPTSPIDLEIGGVKIPVRPVVDGVTILEFTNIASPEEGVELTEEEGREAAQALLGFFQNVVLDFPAFKDACRDGGVDIEELGRIASDLIEAYTDRPTQPPATS